MTNGVEDGVAATAVAAVTNGGEDGVAAIAVAAVTNRGEDGVAAASAAASTNGGVDRRNTGCTSGTDDSRSATEDVGISASTRI